jgi:hypothetical protein
MSLPN